MQGLPVHHQLLEFTQTHVHRVSDTIQPFHSLLPPFPPALKESLVESEKARLKLNIQKTSIIASGPITSRQIDGETMETVTDYFGDSKITADGDCSHEHDLRFLNVEL